MNILVVSHEFPPIGGGGANACYFLTKNFVDAGHQVTIVTSAYSDLPAIEEKNNYTIYRVRAIRKNKDKSNFMEMFTFMISAWFQTQKLAKQTTFDICQVFFGIPSGPIALFLKKKYAIPYIVRLGGGDIPGAQKRFTFLYKILGSLIRSIWKNAKYLVANSEGLKLRAEKFENKYPVVIIPNGVDTEFFSEKDRKESCEEQELRILCVSRLLEGKGLQDVIPYMKEIEKGIGHRVVLQIVGDGPYRENLENITKSYGVEQQVKFEGRKEKDDLLTYYRNADIFILPSRSEGMPNVVLEAMSTGLPIIITPCEGSKELVSNNGIITSAEELISAIVSLGKDEITRKSMGRNSRKAVREQFRWEDISESYLELFSK